MSLEDRSDQEKGKQQAIKALAQQQEIEKKRRENQMKEQSFQGQTKKSLRKMLENI
jgi:hypothetical protein